MPVPSSNYMSSIHYTVPFVRHRCGIMAATATPPITTAAPLLPPSDAVMRWFELVGAGNCLDTGGDLSLFTYMTLFYLDVENVVRTPPALNQVPSSAYAPCLESRPQQCVRPLP